MPKGGVNFYRGNNCKGNKHKGDGSNYIGGLPIDEMTSKSTEGCTLPHGNKCKVDKGKGYGSNYMGDMPKGKMNLKSQEDYTLPHGNKCKGNKRKGDKGKGDGSHHVGELQKDEINLNSAKDYSLPHGGKCKGNKCKGDEGKLDGSNYMGEMPKDEMNLKAPEDYTLPDVKALCIEEPVEPPVIEELVETTVTEESKEQAPSPVILRWQDLDMSKLPKNEIIIKAWEEEDDPNPPRSRKKIGKRNKGKLNKQKRSTAKPKVYEDYDENKDGSPLANYIKHTEFAKLCKMCPNLDSHRTFHCPNLTPGLKERFRSLRDSVVYQPFYPVELGCHFCLKFDHLYHSCPYQFKYPAGAIVGPYAKIVCMCCGEENTHEGVPSVNWDARVAIRTSYNLPNVRDMLKKMELKQASEGAPDVATGNHAPSTTSEEAANVSDILKKMESKQASEGAPNIATGNQPQVLHQNRVLMPGIC